MTTTPEQERVHRRIMDTVSNVAIRNKLPYNVHVLVFDAETNARYGAFVGVHYLSEESRIARVTRTSFGQLRADCTPLDVADTLLKHYTETPLVCDARIAQEFKGDLTWVSDDGHRRLEGRPDGILEIYTDYIVAKIPKDGLPQGVVSGRIFLE